MTGPDARVAVPIAELRDAPDGARQRQLVYGDGVRLLGDRGAWRAVEAVRDGYRGSVHMTDLADWVAPTHWVAALATHLYGAADVKAPDIASLSFGAGLTVLDHTGDFARTDRGLFVPRQHLVPWTTRYQDPAGVAELFLGTPYLWGGNSRLGLDCSGLVQAACLACGLPCPGDSGDQARRAGHPIAAKAPLARNDLIFWEGHVAIALDDTRLIHANAHHMAVAIEPAEDAAARIAEAGGGPVTQRRRLQVRR